MEPYFLPEESICYGIGTNPRDVIATVARRFCGENPPRPYILHAYSEAGIVQGQDGRFIFDFAERFPSASMGTWAYGYGLLWSASDRVGEFTINCHGPLRITLNGELAFKPDIVEEVNHTITRYFPLRLKKGWNSFLVAARRAPSGFGCIVGSPEPKWLTFDFFTPFSERKGMAGWAYALGGPVDVFKDTQPDFQGSEASTGLSWFPRRTWTDHEQQGGPLSRIFGTEQQGFVYGWAGLPVPRVGLKNRILKGHTKQALRIFSGTACLGGPLLGDYTLKIPLEARDLLVEYSLPVLGDENTIRIEDDGLVQGCIQAVQVHGTRDPWLYLGPFAERLPTNQLPAGDMGKLYQDGANPRYWRLDQPETRIRAYLESPQYGGWSYPLGVTMYGLLQTGRVLGDQTIRDYVYGHVGMCVGYHDLSLWDASRAGYPVINNQLVELTMLDDCGSFGSAMLEARLDTQDEASRRLADTIANHMRNRQERQPDGAFYRECKGNFHENTLWADDLYMSTPFMVRYYQLTNDSSWLDDAARQFILFRSYLFIPEIKLMSHVFDFKYHTKTGVPWGRGNGWVLFSLSELLAVLPRDHKNWAELVDFFNEFARGIMAVQGEQGLWHQVLTEPEAYPETSCTAMFIYGLSRSIRLGWLDPALGTQAQTVIAKAWKGLVTSAIDQRGNVYGVCQGSRFSYTKEYYMEELGWKLNDTHGIGIILLAGMEVEKLGKTRGKA